MRPSCGVVAKIIHLFGDKLWEIEPQLTQQVPRVKPFITNDVNDFNNKTHENGISRCSEPLSVHHEVTIIPHRTSSIASILDDNKNIIVSNKTPNIVSTSATTRMEDSCKLQNAMEIALKNAFLSALKNYGKTLQLPLLTSTFYRQYVIPEAEEETLDVKKTKYKKLSNFLNEMVQQGFIVVTKESFGVHRIVSIDLNHPILANLITDVNKKPINSTKRFEPKSLFHSATLTEFYVVTCSTSAFFARINYRRGESIPVRQISRVIKEYMNKFNLPPSAVMEEGSVATKMYVLDECLEKICNTQAATLSSIINSVTQEMDHTYEMGHVKDFINKPRITICLSASKRTTYVNNIECYGIILGELAKLCRYGAAAAATIVQKSKQKVASLKIQGNQVHFIYNLLTETYKIPSRYVVGLELAKDDGKQRKRKQIKSNKCNKQILIRNTFKGKIGKKSYTNYITLCQIFCKSKTDISVCCELVKPVIVVPKVQVIPMNESLAHDKIPKAGYNSPGNRTGRKAKTKDGNTCRPYASECVGNVSHNNSSGKSKVKTKHGNNIPSNTSKCVANAANNKSPGKKEAVKAKRVKNIPTVPTANSISNARGRLLWHYIEKIYEDKKKTNNDTINK